MLTIGAWGWGNEGKIAAIFEGEFLLNLVYIKGPTRGKITHLELHIPGF